MTHSAAQAYLDGVSATPGDTNPYGQGVAGRMWRRGYQENLRQLWANSAAYREYVSGE